MISLIQTAEGALNETHSILQRMRELAVQSASDTNTESDRAEMQKEVDQLSQELSRIGNDTEFNTQNLLSGNFKGTFHIGANEGQNLKVEIGDMRGFSLGVAGNVQAEITDASTAFDLDEGTYSVTGNATDGYELIGSDGSVAATSDDGLAFVASDGTTEVVTFTSEVTSGQVISDGSNATAKTSVTNSGLQAGNYTVSGDTTDGFELSDLNGNVVATSDEGLDFVNADAESVFTTTTELAAGAEVSVGGVDISSQSTADSAITTIQSAIDNVSAERSKLGAVQNRLDHTINNLGTSAENLTAAESRIRDVDMAKEMMEFTKNNILSQAAQSMLAQANQMPQGVLQLLQ